jgi:hypothetical protein
MDVSNRLNGVVLCCLSYRRFVWCKRKAAMSDNILVVVQENDLMDDGLGTAEQEAELDNTRKELEVCQRTFVCFICCR